MSSNRAPKQWCLSKNETLTKIFSTPCLWTPISRHFWVTGRRGFISDSRLLGVIFLHLGDIHLNPDERPDVTDVSGFCFFNVAEID